jgi:hypothetical protein
VVNFRGADALDIGEDHVLGRCGNAKMECLGTLKLQEVGGALIRLGELAVEFNFIRRRCWHRRERLAAIGRKRRMALSLD